jgi:hypothetical protein
MRYAAMTRASTMPAKTIARNVLLPASLLLAMSITSLFHAPKNK